MFHNLKLEQNGILINCLVYFAETFRYLKKYYVLETGVAQFAAKYMLLRTTSNVWKTFSNFSMFVCICYTGNG